MAHDVHDLVQLYDANIHSQTPSSPDRSTCQCTQTEDCDWTQFFSAVITDPDSHGTPYIPDVFTLQEVGNVKHHVPCSDVLAYLNALPGQSGATWDCAFTDADGACAVYWRKDANGFALEDQMQIPLLDTPTFLIQAVKLGTKTGDRHIGIASIHTDPLNPKADNARNHAYVQMQNQWGDIHYVVAGDLNKPGVGGQTGLTRLTFSAVDGSNYTEPGCTSQIDYVFVDKMEHPAGSAGNQRIILQTDPAYSDHRALGVTLYWVTS